MAKKKTVKGSWIVTVKATVMMEVVCDNCTREQAESEPFVHLVNERVTAIPDWDVKGVEPNE